jgi:hypothetical protein
MNPPRLPSVLAQIEGFGKIRIFYIKGVTTPSQKLKDWLNIAENKTKFKNVHDALQHFEDAEQRGIKYCWIDKTGDCLKVHGHHKTNRWFMTK